MCKVSSVVAVISALRVSTKLLCKKLSLKNPQFLELRSHTVKSIRFFILMTFYNDAIFTEIMVLLSINLNTNVSLEVCNINHSEL